MKRILSLILVMVIMFTTFVVGVPEVAAASDKRYTVLVLDTSGVEEFYVSGKLIYKADTAIEYVKAAASNFLSDLINASGDNYVALVTYTGEGKVESGFTNDIKSINKSIKNISAYGSDRNMAAGLKKANELMEDITDTAVTKNVVLFTTGMTDSGDYSYSGYYDANTVGSDWQNMSTGVALYAYANVAYSAAQALKENATLYTLGVFSTLDNIPDQGKEAAEFFKLTARDLASSESCFFDASKPEELEFAFEEIAGDIEAKAYSFKYAGQIIQDHDVESECYYSDQYFYKSSRIYSPSLATMSLCLELSTWPSYEKSEWYNPNDPDSLDDKLVNVKSLLTGGEGLGFSDFMANDVWCQTPTFDSMGVCAARKEIKKNNSEKPYTLIAVVVRGGGYGSEWASNFTVGEEGDHQGFAEARDQVIDFLANQYMPTLSASESENIKLWIVGYSRGGVTAGMVAGKIVDNPRILGPEIYQNDLFCYTFESPQGTLAENMQGDYSNIHNTLNSNDIVPLVAPATWGFARYNYQNPHYLPSVYVSGSDDFEQQKADMLYQLEQEMGFDEKTMQSMGIDFKYDIKEGSFVKTIKFDFSAFLPFGEPLWTVEDTVITKTYDLYEDGLDWLVDEVIGDRSTYVADLEYKVRNIAGIVYHTDGKLAGVDAFLESSGVKEILADVFSMESMVSICAPMFSLNPFKSTEERMQEVINRLKVKLQPLYETEAFEEASEAPGALVDLVCDFVGALAETLSDKDYETFSVMVQFIQYVLWGGLKQAHYPEICLAWCRSQDKNYNSSVVDNDNCAVTRVVRINCPVDVYVYDEKDNVVASIVGDVPAEDSLVVCQLNSEGEKTVYLPGGCGYRVEMRATDNGQVSYSVGEYSYVYSGLTRVENYYDISIRKGDTLSAEVPEATEESIAENSAEGTDAVYELAHNGSKVQCDEKFHGEQAYNLDRSVKVSAEGNGGYVSGTGTFTQGSFAQVEAYTLSTGEFLGWYDDYGALVSDEDVYRFAVKEDTNLTARFTDIELFELTLSSSKGGSISGLSGYYPEDTQISLLPVADEGYVFAGWTSENCSLTETSGGEVMLNMPGANATVYAKFERAGAIGTAKLITVFAISGVSVLAVVLTVVVINVKRNKRKTS